MSDLISRADAIEAVCLNCAYYTDAQCKTDSGYWCESGAMIRENIPSADTVSREEHEEVKAYMDTLVDAFIEDGEELAESVKVVRCKDCKWYMLTDHNDTEVCKIGRAHV